MTILIAQIIFIGTAIALGIIILLQQSQGAGIGASFGSGASGTVFGAKGAGSFLYKLTRILALIFFVSALAMGYLQNQAANAPGILQQTQLETSRQETALDAVVPDQDNGAPVSDTGNPESDSGTGQP